MKYAFPHGGTVVAPWLQAEPPHLQTHRYRLCYQKSNYDCCFCSIIKDKAVKSHGEGESLFCSNDKPYFICIKGRNKRALLLLL